MKLRWKHFLVLLAASLIPLLTVTWISENTSQSLGRTISARARHTLIETARQEMVRTVRDYADIGARGKLAIELALQLMTAQAELALSLPPPSPEKIYFDNDFDGLRSAPKDMAPSRIHRRRTKGKVDLKKIISLDHPNFLLAPGVAKGEVAGDVARFTRLTPTLKGITRQFGDQLYWVYASLETGVHISYPGHGGYPKGYDPRKRPWYLAAQKAKNLIWSAPNVDATTNQLTLTLSMPIRRPDGSFAGVAAIDTQIRHILLERETAARWSRSMSTFLVGTEMGPDSKIKFWVMSSQDPRFSPERQTPSQTPEFKKLFNRIKNKSSGYVEMPYKGEDSLWAFAALAPDLRFVIVVPKSAIMVLSKEVGRMFVDYSRDQAAVTGLAALLALLFVGVVALFTSHVSTGQILKIIDAWRRLADGDFSVRLKTRMNDERDRMIDAFNELVPRLEEHMRMSNALGLAKEVQQSLLPRSDPVFPGFDIAGLSVYCDETGGDYYDFIETSREGRARLAVMVGDVSGHGVSSALLMATARALIMLRSSMPGQAADVINDVNRQLSLDAVETGNFMTFFYCELTEGEAEIEWVRAGHEPALVYDPAADSFWELRGEGPALGLDDSFDYEAFHHRLHPGQVVMVGTDGIWEMHDRGGEMFGKEALMRVIRVNCSQTAKGIAAAVMDALDRFREDEAPEDDITLVVIKVER